MPACALSSLNAPHCRLGGQGAGRGWFPTGRLILQGCSPLPSPFLASILGLIKLLAFKASPHPPTHNTRAQEGCRLGEAGSGGLLPELGFRVLGPTKCLSWSLEGWFLVPLASLPPLCLKAPM